MTAHYQDPALEPQNRPFALLYLRTTEGMRYANHAGEFSDPTFWDTEVIPTFANYYLDAYAAWKRGHLHDVDPAWRIAFRANPEKLNCTQLIYLRINAHINNDLAFMIEDMGARYTYPDHKHVDDVLAVCATWEVHGTAIGEVPRKRHTVARENGTLLTEEVMGYEGFSGNESILLHLHSPCRLDQVGEFRPIERDEWVPDAHVHRLADADRLHRTVEQVLDEQLTQAFLDRLKKRLQRGCCAHAAERICSTRVRAFAARSGTIV